MHNYGNWRARIHARLSAGGAGTSVGSVFEDGLEVDVTVGVVELEAALDVIEVVEHQLFRPRLVALGNGVDDQRVLIVAATVSGGRVVEKDGQAGQHAQLAHAARQRRIARQFRGEGVE